MQYLELFAWYNLYGITNFGTLVESILWKLSFEVTPLLIFMQQIKMSCFVFWENLQLIPYQNANIYWHNIIGVNKVTKAMLADFIEYWRANTEVTLATLSTGHV